MAFAQHARHAAPPAFALTIPWRGVARTWRIGLGGGLVLLGLVAILAIWFLGATAYLVFHDQLLASLMSREADMQYAYEDRIAGLNTELDRQTSRALVDGQTLSTTIRDLAARGQQLEARAARIDALVRQLGAVARPAADTGWPATPTAPDLASPVSLSHSPGLRLDQPAAAREPDDGAMADKHAELSAPSATSVAGVLALVEARQSGQLADLREPARRAVARIETALAETGLPSRLWKRASEQRNVGGPFEPLPESARGESFDIDVALLRDTVARHAWLSEVVRAVPLRRPLSGPLEVTSPFGARLDPFYGRAAMHTGIDLMEAYGGPVRATARGVVTVAGSEGGYGNMVEIDHGNGLTTRYAHLSSIEVSLHETVDVGTVVGLVGQTGRATGPHLHYETRINGEPVDPARFLRAGAGLFPG